MAPNDLAGLRVLVVDDEPLIMDLLESLLQEAGFSVVGLVSTVEKALEVARLENLDGVLLDANLHGKSAAPVAEILQARGIPFVVATGYGDSDLAGAALNAAPRLKKPFDYDELKRIATATFQR